MRREMMKKLALVLTLLMLSSTAQATTHYEETTTLFCKWSDDYTETFTLNGARAFNGNIHEGWTVKRISQLKYSIEVRLDGPEGEILYIDFNNGWPCRVETRLKPIQPESDNFNQID